MRISVAVKEASDFEAGPLQLRGAVRSAFEEAMKTRGGEAVVDAENPELSLLDLGGGPR